LASALWKGFGRFKRKVATTPKGLLERDLPSQAGPGACGTQPAELFGTPSLTCAAVPLQGRPRKG